MPFEEHRHESCLVGLGLRTCSGAEQASVAGGRGRESYLKMVPRDFNIE